MSTSSGARSHSRYSNRATSRESGRAAGARHCPLRTQASRAPCLVEGEGAIQPDVCAHAPQVAGQHFGGVVPRGWGRRPRPSTAVRENRETRATPPCLSWPPGPMRCRATRKDSTRVRCVVALRPQRREHRDESRTGACVRSVSSRAGRDARRRLELQVPRQGYRLRSSHRDQLSAYSSSAESSRQPGG